MTIFALKQMKRSDPTVTAIQNRRVRFAFNVINYMTQDCLPRAMRQANHFVSRKLKPFATELPLRISYCINREKR
jgi:hypothetical protein